MKMFQTFDNFPCVKLRALIIKVANLFNELQELSTLAVTQHENCLYIVKEIDNIEIFK